MGQSPLEVALHWLTAGKLYFLPRGRETLMQVDRGHREGWKGKGQLVPKVMHARRKPFNVEKGRLKSEAKGLNHILCSPSEALKDVLGAHLMYVCVFSVCCLLKRKVFTYRFAFVILWWLQVYFKVHCQSTGIQNYQTNVQTLFCSKRFKFIQLVTKIQRNASKERHSLLAEVLLVTHPARRLAIFPKRLLSSQQTVPLPPGRSFF